MRRIPPALVAVTGLVLAVDLGLLALGDVGDDDSTTDAADGPTTTAATGFDPTDPGLTTLPVTVPTTAGPGPTPPAGPGSGLTSDGAGEVAEGGKPLADTGAPGIPLVPLAAAAGAVALVTAEFRRRSVTLVACADGSPAPSERSSSR